MPDDKDVAPDEERIVMVWPRPKDYSRFVEVCGPEDVPGTYLEFVQMVSQSFNDLGIDQEKVERVAVDAYEMRDWCLREHGDVDSEARAAYALMLYQARQREDGDTLH